MFKALRMILALVDLLFLRNKKRVAIPCINDDEWQGNCAFLYKYLLKHQSEYGIEIVVLTSRRSKLHNDDDACRNVQTLYSFRGLMSLFTSGVVIYHHGPLAGRIPIFPWRRIGFHINHGIHYKKVELALDNKSVHRGLFSIVKTKWFTPYHAVSSHVDALSCCTYYHTNLRDVFVTGIPRNDLFFQEDNYGWPSGLRRDVAQLVDMSQNKKIIAYAPTWRKSGSYEFSRGELKALTALLDKHNAILFYAGHPYLEKRCVPDSHSIIDFNRYFNDIQSLLLKADLLITDYSSVWIDFLLRGKPVISFQYDKSSYQDYRGFLFDTDELFPGEIVEDVTGLLQSIEQNLDSDYVHPNYSSVKRMFHSFEDGSNCKRITEVISDLARWTR
ncbi:CDP-glycerol glycerophosphotransferase family protein [Vibrio hepatarius]|uniref:CDP-glycerol glycerophosphotransferase family protein n=1 Tax=Vibrio hepatarius TaxID=171383 RepID=UPI0037360C71